MTLRTSDIRAWPGITTAALFAVALAACSAPPDRAATDDYPVFHAAATEDDVAEIAHSQNLVTDMELPADEVRWVGQHDDTDFYATIGPSETVDDGHILCFIIAAHELEVAGASCSSDPYDPSDPTLQNRVGAPGGAVQAFLIPAETQLEEADGWHRASEHVVVLTDPAAQPELMGTVADETDIVLQRITG